MYRITAVTTLLGSLALIGLQGCAHMGEPEVLYIARHGQTEWNRTGRLQGDPDLDPVGYVNRFSLWHLMKDAPLDAIYTSELQRTKRTAELVAEQHDITPQPRASLNEISPGVFTGMCFSQLSVRAKSRYPGTCEVRSRGSNPAATLKVVRELFAKTWGGKLEGRPPLGQSFSDLVEQTAAFVEELRRGLATRQVLVVGHGVVNRALLHHLMGWPEEAVADLRQENDQVFRLETRGSQRTLSVYTPGVGWQQCSQPPREGQKYLDCQPQSAGGAPPASPPPAAEPTPEPPEPPATPEPPEPPRPPEPPQPTTPIPPPPEPPAE